MRMRCSVPFDVHARWSTEDAVVSVSGEVDLSTAPALDSYLQFVLDQGEHHVVIDLTGVEFIDSSGLEGLVPAAERAQAAGGCVTLRGGRRVVDLILELTGLDLVLGVDRMTWPPATDDRPQASELVAGLDDVRRGTARPITAVGPAPETH